jgi:hypothetical protein
MTRDVREWRKQLSFECGPGGDRPGEEPSVSVFVHTEAARSCLERAVHDDRRPVVQRVRQHGWRFHHGQIEIEPTEEW